MTASKQPPLSGRRNLAIAAAIGVIGLIAAVLWITLAHFNKKQLSDTILEQIPALPDTEGWPEAFSEALSDAHAGIIRGGDTLASLKELAMLFHANAFVKEAAICYELLEERAPNEPRWPYFQALLRLDQGDLASGESLLERSVTLVPDHLPSLLKLGNVRFKSDRPEAALEAYRRCLLVEPGVPQALLGVIRNHLYRRKNEEAFSLLSKLLIDIPDFGPGHTLMAQLLERRGDSPGAEASSALGDEYGRYPDPPDPWMYEVMKRCYDVHQLTVWADMHVVAGQFEVAFRIFDRAEAIAPDSPTVPFIRGLRLAELGDSDGAINSFETALGLGGDTEPAYVELVRLYKSGKDYEKAMDTARRGLEENPNSSRLHTALGELLLLKGDLSQAESHLLSALREDPYRPEAIGHLAQTLLNLGREPEAIEKFEVLRRLSPSNVYSRSFLARVYLQNGDFQKAEAPIREARALKPKDTEMRRVMLGFLKEYGNQMAQKEQFAEAAGYYQEALDINPDWVDLHRDLALVYASMENWNAAAENLAIYLNKRPGDIGSWLLLGDVLWSAGEFSKARRHWRKAKSLARYASNADGLMGAIEERLQQPVP